MSNTPCRLRGETDFDTLDLCDQLVRKTISYVMNEKHVPKRYRFIFTERIVGYAYRVREYVELANAIKAENQDRLDQRYKYQTNALSYANNYQDTLVDMEETLDGVTCENLREIVDILDSLIRYIINWRKSDHIV